VSPYVRMVRTASGATAVQIVHSSHQGSRDIEHSGSAHDDVEENDAMADEHYDAIVIGTSQRPVPPHRAGEGGPEGGARRA
jgi:hypothetical protein